MKLLLRSLLTVMLVVGAHSFVFAQDQSSKTEKTNSAASPASTRSLVYFYRLKAITGSALEPLVLCDDKPIAKMDNGRYFAVSFEAGDHACYIGDKKSGFEVDMKAGETRYAKITLEAGFWKGHGIITLVQAEQATFEIKKLKLLGADKVKDRDVVTIFEGTNPTP